MIAELMQTAHTSDSIFNAAIKLGVPLRTFRLNALGNLHQESTFSSHYS